MAHDFLGTFNKSQFERLVTFARSQVGLIEGRLRHIVKEQERIGTLTFGFDSDNVPNSVSAKPNNSYLAKLLSAYEVLGGNPFYDLRTRSKTQALFVVKGSEDSPAMWVSNGEPLPTRGLRDAYSAELVRRIRAPLQGALERRFEALERKIRRAIDYYEQLSAEASVLRVWEGAATLSGSLEDVSTQIQDLFGDRNYRAIFDDGGADPIGATTYAPFSTFDVERPETTNIPTRTVPQPQRQSTGYVKPGSEGSTA